MLILGGICSSTSATNSSRSLAGLHRTVAISADPQKVYPVECLLLLSALARKIGINDVLTAISQQPTTTTTPERSCFCFLSYLQKDTLDPFLFALTSDIKTRGLFTLTFFRLHVKHPPRDLWWDLLLTNPALRRTIMPYTRAKKYTRPEVFVACCWKCITAVMRPEAVTGSSLRPITYVM